MLLALRIRFAAEDHHFEADLLAIVHENFVACDTRGACPAYGMSRDGNTATAAIDRVKERGAKEIRFVCLIAAQQGVERVRGLHPDVRLWTAAIDDRLDERGFIVRGLGDAGDGRHSRRRQVHLHFAEF